MSSKRINLIVISFVSFIILVIIATSAAIYSTPTEVVSGTAGNYSANLCNGGYVIEDEGFLFFTYPDKSGIYRAETDKSEKAEKISEKGEGFLQVLGSGYYFTDNNKFYRCDWAGERMQTVKDYAEKPLVVGSLLFYIDEQGRLIKYSMQNDTTTVVISDKKVKEYAVYYKKIYYIDESGNIKKVSFNGDNDELFISAKAEKLSIDGQYIFYIENGKLTSAMLKDDQILKAQITSVTEYAIYGSYAVYTDGDKTYYADVNKILSDKKYSPKVISTSASSGISIDEEHFYYFSNGVLNRITHDGKNKIEIK